MLQSCHSGGRSVLHEGKQAAYSYMQLSSALLCWVICCFAAGIVAGMLVQNTLKYLLEFGAVSRYLGYNSLKDFFPSMDIKPNTACCNNRCLDAQQAYQVR
jgi:hypothetical protein